MLNQLGFAAKEQKPNYSPRCVDFITLKRFQYAWHYRAYTREIALVYLNRFLIAYSPMKLRIKRDDQSAWRIVRYG